MSQKNSSNDSFDKAIAEKIRQFREFKIGHRKLAETDQQLMQAIRRPDETSLIFVFGPTGVGKTTLIEGIKQKVYAAAQARMMEDMGYIPIAGLEAKTPEDRNFSWKDFYVRALMALDEPMIDKKIKINPKATKDQLRLSLESALRYRYPDAFYIDEAQNFGKVASGQSLQNQADSIKSLANLAQTRLILCGVYELLTLRNLNGQLCRRSCSIHFPRYRAELDLDRQDFILALKTLLTRLPLPEEPDLVERWDFFYEKSIGCVGILKDLLLQSLKYVLERDRENARTLTISDLECCAWSTAESLIMLQEAKEGEQKVAEQTGLQAELRASLGLDSLIPPSSQTPSNSSDKTSTKKSRKVGKPNPQRRPVG